MDDFLGRSARGVFRESENYLPNARARWTSPGLPSNLSPMSHEEPSFGMKRPWSAVSAPSDVGEQQLSLGIFCPPRSINDVAEDSNGAWRTNRISSGSSGHGLERGISDCMETITNRSPTVPTHDSPHSKPPQVMRLMGVSIEIPPDPTPEPTGMITNLNPPGRSIHLSQSASKSRSPGDRHVEISPRITEASSSRLPSTTSVTTIEAITSISEQDEKKGLLVNELKVGEPVMTEEQFIRACRKYSNDLARENDNNATRKTVHEEATRRLMENYEAWYKHWKKIANLDFDLFTENMTTKMRCMIINYLLYVEMISTTIPISKDAVGSELKKAFELAQIMFGPGRINQQIKNTKMYEECYNIRRQVNKSRKQLDVSPGLWKFLRIWMRVHRKDLLDKILVHHLWYTAKRFLNTNFYSSIEKLNTKLKSC
ncbi:hypothetical protein MJO28_010553 [Puccinia striiformis f. sp. tritici]|uniref:Uncharacterized protein n=1 Tax=Puccinia striiformis f. sp. tritici TaxID=168172 RepID=A0ACC0E7W7_9BASI|nr:hypothetical protein Pst134EA_019351 [Puccinia striiformis f. sp. tritici]KAH9459202.1 hypothetical protein Pst134EA_019351 [Puccinia striiformis f. sp. tritici]KAI7944858.1 hypothetical protein MJO28_010553 [Puccinia striiformis f. sp. tritici]KAI7948632.1 hypothetical protein MJO29_010297 [Puccinia striiformis f. sp. tritici]